MSCMLLISRAVDEAGIQMYFVGRSAMPPGLEQDLLDLLVGVPVVQPADCTLERDFIYINFYGQPGYYKTHHSRLPRLNRQIVQYAAALADQPFMPRFHANAES